MNDRAFRLRVMYWYNIFVTGGFAVLIAVMKFFPDLRTSFSWPEGGNPVVISLVVPLYVIMAVFAARALSDTESGTMLLKIQIAYKPFAILMLIGFAVKGAVHPIWTAIIVTGLLVYIAGNVWALKKRPD